MEVMYGLMLFFSEGAKASSAPSPASPAETAKDVQPPNPEAVSQPAGLTETISSFIHAHPVLTGLIVLAVILLVFALFIYLKTKDRKKPWKAPVYGTTKNPNNFVISIGNAHHIGARESQQDSFGISDISNSALCSNKGIFAVVADGMGGLSNGGEVSAIATSSMLKYFNEKAFHSTLEIELLNMISSVNDDVNRYLGREGRGKSGTTVVSVILQNRQLYWVAVGDSRICLIRNGALIQINREHTYGPDLDEKAAMGEISGEDAQGNPQRAALTSYLGMGKLEKIDRNIRPLQLVRGDRVILMTDGVFGTLSDEEILSVMNFPPYESAARIEQMILSKSKPKQDNFTAVILECL